MQKIQVSTSDNYKTTAIKAILAIVFFIITYLLLIALGIGLTALCVYGGISLIALRPSFITLMVGLGLISTGTLVLVFLLKFLFKSHKADLSHLTEIKKEEEPRLFAFIDDIVEQAGTNFPKKIYLSGEVNASVFYDSSFWSMFLPIRKNLQIGIGLVNTISEDEFKAILAHEFGHFSQRTMKVGSYVYNVNQIIYNLLYDNDSFYSLAQKLANINGYLSFFIRISVKIVEGIQWLLRKVYNIVNLNYLQLSREMEFQADEVAAHIAGSKSLTTALLRLELSDHSFQVAVDYYNDKIEDSIQTRNIFPQQAFVMNFLARESNLAFQDNLPQLTPDYSSRFHQSKLVIKDQWASHPSTEDRVSKLKKLNIEKENKGMHPAFHLFQNPEAIQEKITSKLFSSVSYSSSPVFTDTEQFIENFLNHYQKTTFNKVFKGYYDKKNPVLPDAGQTPVPDPASAINELFNDKTVDLLNTHYALESDISTLSQVETGDVKIRFFEYDGYKYPSRDGSLILPKLKQELEELKIKIARHDALIHQYFFSLAEKQGLAEAFEAKFNSFLKLDQEFENRFSTFIRMSNGLNFINHDTPFEVIEENFSSLFHQEKNLKAQIQEILQEEAYQEELTPVMLEAFAKYTSENWVYFSNQNYNNENISILVGALNHFYQVVVNTHFNTKKKLLDFMVSLEEGNARQLAMPEESLTQDRH